MTTTSNITFDTSELDDLNDMLVRAAVRVASTRARGIERAANSVRDQAASTAASYPHATGALAADVAVSGTALTKIVGSDLREAFFLEFGSPTTGGPRPWLTGPARTEMLHLLEALSEASIPQ
jgi:hypothetical protein